MVKLTPTQSSTSNQDIRELQEQVSQLIDENRQVKEQNTQLLGQAYLNSLGDEKLFRLELLRTLDRQIEATKENTQALKDALSSQDSEEVEEQTQEE